MEQLTVLKIKKVNKPWKYEVIVNGNHLPFVCDVEITKGLDNLTRAKISVIVAENKFGKIIIEE